MGLSVGYNSNYPEMIFIDVLVDQDGTMNR